MNYDLDLIKETADCRQIADLLGIPKAPNGRYIATWRGGSNGNVAIEEKEWYDHVEKDGGDVIKLVQVVKGGCPFIMAVNWLAQQVGVKPIEPFANPGQKNRHSTLMEEGYVEVSKDAFTDVDGTPLHYEVRMEHPTQPKQFIQCDAQDRWSIKHVETVLFNLPKVSKSTYALIVEGVKDAKTLIEWGFAATTNAGGAGNWKDSYSDSLAGKICVIIPDNDIAGEKHVQIVGKSLTGKAKEVRVLRLSSYEKGDVTDWRDKEGGTKAQLTKLIKEAPKWVPMEDNDAALLNAKEANEKPFSNYIVQFNKSPGQKDKPDKKPRLIKDMLDDLNRRFLGFPRCVGEGMLFDHDRDLKSIRYLSDCSELFAWMNEKSGKSVNWTKGDGFMSKDEFFRSVRANAIKYESVSKVPDWPRRDDVYYAHPPLPEPSEGQKVFEGLVDMFSPANEYFRALLCAMFSAPMYFKRGIPRPLWIIDSEDGQGTGKTTIAESVAELYGDDPIHVDAKTLQYNMDRVVKSMLSTTGRDKRVFLLDNVTGNYKSDELSKLVTNSSITGMAPYGRGEETRPNNLTYILTANSATIDSDIASRSFFIFVKRATVTKDWKSRLMDYISQHRLQIFADMIERMHNGKEMDEQCRTRFPEFEKTVLQKQCKNLAELKSVYAVLEQSRDESNVEEELANQIEQIIEDRLGQFIQMPRTHRVFIPTKSLVIWLKNELDYPVKHDNEYPQLVKNLAKSKMLECISLKPSRFPHHEKDDVKPTRGIMYVGPSSDPNDQETYFVTYRNSQNNFSIL